MAPRTLADGAAVRAESWMDEPPGRPLRAQVGAREPAWPPAAPARCAPPLLPGADAEGDVLVVRVELAGADARTHLRAQDAALEAARSALAVVPEGDRGDVAFVATRARVVVRVRCGSQLAAAVAVARGVLEGWRAAP